MHIGILGSGLMGGKLGTIFARAGHDVVFSYSRSERKLKRLAREARGHARAGTPREAALNGDVLLLAGIDAWVTGGGLEGQFAAPHRDAPTSVGAETKLSLDLIAAGIGTVIWATGYRPDYSWLDVPVLDRHGRIRHDGGVVAAPDMYVMGLPFMRRRKSSFIDGAADDAADLAAHLHRSLDRAAA